MAALSAAMLCCKLIAACEACAHAPRLRGRYLSIVQPPMMRPLQKQLQSHRLLIACPWHHEPEPFGTTNLHADPVAVQSVRHIEK